MRNLKVPLRLTPLLFYGLSVPIVRYAYPIAAKAYNDLCSSQGMTFGEGLSASHLGIALVIVSLPLFLARGNALVLANLTIGLVTICGAGSVLHTAANTPTNASRKPEPMRITPQASMVSNSGSVSPACFLTLCW
ncbi:hypothetical protein [Bradyrhizobium tropiciagri]|uniref:hypothetical protein n=1 Tax=Bradyrhizobium tropiciagri TaxID=312253 RepID=UPI000A572D0D|nr:hypothetical protein [Bradyrhizobium tropiciagri]